jgi:hypothetical protein
MRTFLVLLVLGWGGIAEAGYETLEASLVGGEPEAGWPAVGAMTSAVPGVIYMGSFCSGTLITEDWVLTAAHCVQGDQGQSDDPRMIRFMVGDDARPVNGLDEPEGQVYHQADRVVVHPEYNPNANLHDVALVHLAAPVTDVTPIGYRAEELPKELQGEDVFYVGFGVDSGETYSGGGVKRSGWIPIWLFDVGTYLSEFMGVGVCFGDSGGPGLYEFEDGWRAIGVNSWVAGGGPDPCVGISVQTRVDVHASWIEATLAGGGPDCRTTPGVCWCPQACAADGRCENGACETRSCGATLDCALGCEEWDSGCRVGCYLRAAPSAKGLLKDLLSCLAITCMGSTIYDLEDGACPQVGCKDQRLSCDPAPTGEGTCRDLVTCAAACPPGDGECRYLCYAAGTHAAQGIYDAYAACTMEGCGAWPSPGLELSCDWESCSVHLETCLPPKECSQLGGGCPAGSACREAPTGNLNCFPTGGVEVGAACDPEGPDLQCVDGAGCVLDTDGSGKCLPLCGGPGACGDEAECQGEGPVPGLGICLCHDADGDGVCMALDCDDQDPGARPGGGERCYDGVDNDCDGEIDEGCVTADVADEDAGGCAAVPAAKTPVWLAWLLVGVALATWISRSSARSSTRDPS